MAYSHADNEIVYNEIRWIQDQGFNLTYDEGTSPGSSWSDSIAERIQQCSCFLFFISPQSVRSEHCRRELSFAIEENRNVLAVYLAPTDAPPGIRLSLNNRQAILKYSIDSDTYQRKLANSLSGAGLQNLPKPVPAAPHKRHLTISVHPTNNLTATADRVASLVQHLSWQGGIYRARATGSSTAEPRADYRVLLGILEGSPARIRWEVIRSDSGDVVWASTAQEHPEEFALEQDRIAEMIAVGTLKMVSDHERDLACDCPIEELTFVQLMLRTEQLNYLDKQQVDDRSAALNRAIELEPSSALPYASLAGMLSWQIINGVSSNSDSDRARLLDMSRRALRLSSNDPAVLLHIGTTYCRIGKYQSGLSLIRRAYDLAPTVNARDQLARSLCFAGQPDEAVALFEEILATMPAGLSFPYVRLAVALAQTGRLDDAVQSSEKSVVNFPEDYYGWFVHANLLAQTGEIEAAREALAEGQRLVPNLKIETVIDNTASTYARTEEQRRWLTAGLLLLMPAVS